MCPKAHFFECKFRISQSAIVHVQSLRNEIQRVGSMTSETRYTVALQRVNVAYCMCKTGI